IEKLMPNGENDILFGNIIRSDGFCVDFLFYRRIEPKQDDTISLPKHKLELQDFIFEEVENVYRPPFIDPGRRSVFTATIGLDSSQHQKAKSRFNLYQSRQKAPEYMVNMLLDGTAKYNRKKEARRRRKRKRGVVIKARKKKLKFETGNKAYKWSSTKFEEEDKNKMPLIVFGNGIFGKDLVKLKGLRCGIVEILWRCLKKREAAGDLLVVPIDEFKTSRICNKYSTYSLNAAKYVKGQSVLVCKNCNTL
ncbi:hypothetical protein EDC94DRAFT_514539, partial [Helicostylum pulchrum]